MVTLIIFGTTLQENIHDYENLFENRSLTLPITF